MGGDLLRLALFELMTAGEVQKGLPGLRDGGEEEAELGELGGATAVFQGVKVAGLAAGAWTAATPAARAGGWWLAVWSWRHGCTSEMQNGSTDGGAVERSAMRIGCRRRQVGGVYGSA